MPATGRSARSGLLGAALALALLVAGCGSTGDDPELGSSSPGGGEPAGADDPATDGAGDPDAGPAAEDPDASDAPGATATPLVPEVADSPEGLAEQIEAAEEAVRDPDTPADELAEMAHVQQVAYRTLAEQGDWHEPVIEALPDDLAGPAELHLAARLEFTSLNATPPDDVPAWRIVAPEPADDLRSYYEEGEDEYGIDWEYLAAINLVETGMGRIRGTSSAGAQGPMQFIPSTWARYGEGDIDDPHDAILSAARYLNASGGANGDIEGALFAYNNDVRYVRGVLAYARVMQDDPATFRGLHQWQIWYASASGDVLLPEGYHLTEPLPANAYADQYPDRTR